MQRANPEFVVMRPGAYVHHPTEDWGLGQVQSIDGNRITCNFEHRGKVTINGSVIALVAVDINKPTD
ncbi:MAG: DUF3553 domain-containing protein [Alphaproteobacteria bacterium]|nr:DUF3553 domain-containing protein [Alphaproteobacteria bacterium]